MSRIYALANQKGGVGKTTTAINVAACIAEAGARVLLVDFDPQANATTGLGLRPPRGRSTYDLLHGASMRDIIVETSTPGLSLAPAHPDLAAAAVELPDREDRDRILGAALAQVGDEYPYVLVDCPPSLGMLTLNALVAANRLIVPVQCEYYALEGLAQLLETVELIRAKVNPKLSLTGLLLTMHDGRTRLAADVAREVRSHFGPKVFASVIPRNVRIAEAPSHGRPISTYDPRSTGAEAYYRVALEVVERG
jgi:chromosome partitioning protein